MAQKYFPTVNFTPVVDDEIRKNLRVVGAIEGVPKIPSVSWRHDKLRILPNSISKRYRVKRLLTLLYRHTCRCAIFLHNNKTLNNEMKCRTFVYDERDLRARSEAANRHRVEIMFDFICEILKQEGFRPNVETIKCQPERYSLASDEKPACMNTEHALDLKKVRIALTPFAENHNKWKSLGISNASGFAEKILNEYRDKIQVVLLAKNSHKNIASKIERRINDSTSSFISIIPKDLDDFFSVASQMDYFVTIDSGSLHVAELLDIPSCGVYGPTDENETGPFQEQYKNEKHRICRRQMRTNPSVRLDKNIILSSSLSADDVYEEVVQHMRELQLV